jgi:hypothetical protein
MASRLQLKKPFVGMNVAFKSTEAAPFTDVPSHVVHVWPRFRSGDYLVSLELAVPVKTHEGVIAHIDAFMSELVDLERPCSAGANAPLRFVTLFLTL